MKKISGHKIIKIIYWFALLSFVLPACALIYRAAAAENTAMVQTGDNSRANRMLMLQQCLLGAIVLHVPWFFRKCLKIKIPAPLHIMYIVFLYCAIFLGEVWDFYYRVPHWDKLLHGFSAFMAGKLGFLLADVLNDKNSAGVTFSPAYAATFALCFAVSVGVLWEIYEYAFDGILGLNMQRFMLKDGTQLLGRAALEDTMKDIIIDVCGSLAAAAAGYISIKRRQKIDLDKQSVLIDEPAEKIRY